MWYVSLMTTTQTAGPRFIGKCVRCRTTYAWDGPTPMLGGTIPGYCGCHADHGKPNSFVQAKTVKVVVKPEINCGAKCYNAKSDGCTCSCGGRNHGEAHTNRSVLA